MSTATIRVAGGRATGTGAVAGVLGPVAEGRPGTMVPVEAPVEAPVEIPSGEPAEPAGDSIEVRVRRGALLLDATTPGWAAKIDPNRLWMWSCSSCVLGQLYQVYAGGLERLGLPRGGSAGVEHGFYSSPSEGTAVRWLDLADAWRVEIRSRRPEGRG